VDWFDAASAYYKRTWRHDARLSSLPAEWQRELVALMLANQDVNNGGYLQFFANHGREAYGYASRALKAIGAPPHGGDHRRLPGPHRRAPAHPGGVPGRAGAGPAQSDHRPRRADREGAGGSAAGPGSRPGVRTVLRVHGRPRGHWGLGAGPLRALDQGRQVGRTGRGSRPGRRRVIAPGRSSLQPARRLSYSFGGLSKR
jgi:Domain of unknown function (DUF4375)